MYLKGIRSVLDDADRTGRLQDTICKLAALTDYQMETIPGSIRGARKLES
jgi:hypothetical protein